MASEEVEKKLICHAEPLHNLVNLYTGLKMNSLEGWETALVVVLLLGLPD